MNRHAGPACALSVLIVGVFAVILHDKNPPVEVARSPAVSSHEGRISRPEPPDHGHPPEPRRPPSSPQTTPIAVQPSSKPASVPSPSLKETSLTKSETLKPQVEPAPPEAEKKTKHVEADRASRPLPPRGAFTVVREGEKLADVAARVYGSSDSTEALWRANRDQVALIDSVLPRGTLLRTP